MNEPCNTLGLANVGGMCQMRRSCSINEDNGLALAYTISHEMGHNFGMHHDSNVNGCPVEVTSKHIMSPHLLAEVAADLVWSSCSRQEITNFLDHEWGECLNDPPDDHEFRFPQLPPGAMYNADHQCRLQYGNNATQCQTDQDVCVVLWCEVDGKCLTRLESAADGTECNKDKWCYKGECIAQGTRPESIDGGWSDWNEWSECSRPCGVGISHALRYCDNPLPSHGGKYCIGERKRYRTCNIQKCPSYSESFRSHQCARYNRRPYNNKYYEWGAELVADTPCELHCKPTSETFIAKLSDVVIDGTECPLPSLARHEPYRSICVGGICKPVGCDSTIDSSAIEDRCGVCEGDGMSCHLVSNTFTSKMPARDGRGYRYVTSIPRGARAVNISELTGDNNNYLAVQDERGKSLLNGNFFIQWEDDYDLGGTNFQYKRNGSAETLYSLGPVLQTLKILILHQSHESRIKVDYLSEVEGYTASSTNTRRSPTYTWKYSPYSQCSATCGGGVQISEAVCWEKQAGRVGDQHCSDVGGKPGVMERACNLNRCPARWWPGPWQQCSVTCGDEGMRVRSILCVQTLHDDEQVALPDRRCGHLEKPVARERCHRYKPCPGEEREWIVGPWAGRCHINNACGYQHRSVTCQHGEDESKCDISEKPAIVKQCQNITTCGHWVAVGWSTCTRTCGQGIYFRKVLCTGGEACDLQSKPRTIDKCNVEECPLFPLPALNTTSTNPSGDTTTQQPYYNHTRATVSKKFANKETAKQRWAKLSSYLKMFKRKKWSGKSLAHNRMQADAPDGGIERRLVNMKMIYEWRRGLWSKCSRECGGGYQTRSVQCHDDKFNSSISRSHCSYKKRPQSLRSCNQMMCANWFTAPWSDCSVSCGKGVKKRHVGCSTPHRCDINTKPAHVMDCHMPACTHWRIGNWTQCSKTCDQGMQVRDVTCVDSVTGEATYGCNRKELPESIRFCKTKRCVGHTKKSKSCVNSLSDDICTSLRYMCKLKYFARKCCGMCREMAH